MTSNPTPPTHLHPTEEQLNDFVDARLEDVDAARVRHHLELCVVCRTEVEELRALLRQVEAAPRAITPPRDLWAGIQARLVESGTAPAQGRLEAAAPPAAPAGPRLVPPIARPVRSRHPLTHYWMPLAAAAVALVVMSSAITHVLTKPTGFFPPRAATDNAPARVLVPRLKTSVEPAALASRSEREPQSIGAAEKTFEGAASDLRAAFEARKSQLKPTTVATVEENLRLIDQALLRARAALESDPGNPDLNSMVTSTWKMKVELLEKAVRLSSEI